MKREKDREGAALLKNSVVLKDGKQLRYENASLDECSHFYVQLIASGVLPVTEYPTFDAQNGLGLMGQEDEEAELEVELNEDDPPFLHKGTKSSRDLSPVRIVKNPDGSLQRAAMTQSQLAAVSLTVGFL